MSFALPAMPPWLAQRFSPTSRMETAIALSVLFHTLLLGMHFGFPGSDRTLSDKALDIVLVNAKSARRPNDAQVLAQSNLDGGGISDKDKRTKTPLPATHKQSQGAELEQKQRRVRELEARQQLLMTQVKTPRNTDASAIAQKQPEQAPTLSGRDLAESARAMARQEGEISRSVEEYGKRPRKTQASLRAREVPFAQYVESWRAKVERIGTLNYPEAARGKLYGTLLLTVQIRADGTLAAVEVNRTSGHPILDDAARRIVQMAAPYAALPPEIRRDTDILEITRTWSFTPGDLVKSSQ